MRAVDNELLKPLIQIDGRYGRAIAIAVAHGMFELNGRGSGTAIAAHAEACTWNLSQYLGSFPILYGLNLVIEVEKSAMNSGVQRLVCPTLGYGLAKADFGCLDKAEILHPNKDHPVISGAFLSRTTSYTENQSVSRSSHSSIFCQFMDRRSSLLDHI